MVRCIYFDVDFSLHGQWSLRYLCWPTTISRFNSLPKNSLLEICLHNLSGSSSIVPFPILYPVKVYNDDHIVHEWK